MRPVLILGVVTLLAACATAATDQPEGRSQSPFDAMLGAGYADAVEHLGPPTSETETGPTRVCIWRYDRRTVIELPQTAPTRHERNCGRVCAPRVLPQLASGPDTFVVPAGSELRLEFGHSTRRVEAWELRAPKQ